MKTVQISRDYHIF